MNSINVTGIAKCEVTECSYNMDSTCQACGITVGGPDPLCDTFFHSDHKGGKCSGGVGACKVEQCAHNDSLECSANEINVSTGAGKAWCSTFRPL